MSRIVMLSSWVAHGHVGLSAAAPVLQILGHDTIQLPTVILSNHPAWPHVAGQRIPPDTLRDMIRALRDNGWLEDNDALLIGYLPTPDHVAVAAGLVGELRAASPGIRVIVDPILGDHPKGLYIPEDAATALRDLLVPLADILTPNLFELGWIAGLPTATLDQARAAAEALVARHGPAAVFVTSPPVDEDTTGILAADADGARLFPAPLYGQVPHGVGDVFAALIATGLPVAEALGHLNALIGMSLGCDHLLIAEAAEDWVSAPPLATAPHPLDARG